MRPPVPLEVARRVLPLRAPEGDIEVVRLVDPLAAGVSAVGQTTLSIGVNVAADEEPDAAWLGRADQALYTVKRGGRDGVELAPAPHGAAERDGDADPLAA